MTDQPAVIVRTYKAKDNAAAATLYAAEAAGWSKGGYVPTMQVWVGPPIARRIITPIVLVILGVVLGVIFLGGALLGAFGGILAGLAYIVAVKPDGVLTVTYARTG